MSALLPKYDIVSIEDLSIEDIERIFALADEFSAALAAGTRLQIAAGLVMATLFYEPSTRTRMSFESAMHRLGGSVISAADMHTSSAAKGESLADTARVVSGYADLIVVRHPHDGAARVAADYAPCTIINAGDGSREHPTQTLCDLYTLIRKKGQLRGLNVAICGDLKFGRTVHSLIYALARFGANIVAVPNRGMNVPDYVLARLRAERGYSLSTLSMNELKSIAGGLDAFYLTPTAPHQMALFTSDIAADAARVRPEAPAALDAFYVTRLQKERMPGGGAEIGDYVHFDARALKTTRTQEAVVMHPLPRTDELAYELDSDPRAVYFEQAAAGVPIRMALIAWMLERAKKQLPAPNPASSALKFKIETAPRCLNSNCISRHESRYLRPRFRPIPKAESAAAEDGQLMLQCEFCERELVVEYVGHSRSRRYYRYEDNLHGYVQSWMEDGSLVVFENVKQAEESGYEPYKRGPQREVMNAGEIADATEALATQIVADIPDLASVSMVGVVSRGAILALRIRDAIEAATKVHVPCAVVEVHSGYDRLEAMEGPSLDTFDIEARTIVLVDDVINSGWTVQRAMATLWKRGRPAAMRLAVLIDRGHRALPIRPNYVGKNIPTARADRVQVKLVGDPSGRAADRVVIYSMLESNKPAAKPAEVEHPS